MRIQIFAYSVLAMIFGLSLKSFAQDNNTKILLNNPSFEDKPRHSKVPIGWTDCGFPGESEPDIQPSGFFSVNKPAQDGNTYMGMVVRDNDTWESVSQKLSRKLEKGKCYEFSIYMCRSELYVSQSRLSEAQSNYTTPAKLRIYGGFNYCDKQFLLAESALVVSTRWIEYKFRFEPIDNYTHLVFEAFYKTPTLFPYNGNILLDNASAIEPVPCKEPVPIAQVPPKEVPPTKETTTNTSKNPAPGANNAKNNTNSNTAIAIKNTPTPQETIKTNTTKELIKTPIKVDFSTVKRADLSKGQTLQVPNLMFAVDDTLLTNSSYPVLDKVYTFLTNNQDLVVEIGGHTNGICQDDYCNHLSEKRAKAVAEYLTKKGIAASRLKIKGYGKTMPISSVASDPRNQRVEIKILTFNG
jgi:outer membrane protein OmpA-like peptidoglycan-associated protein